MLIVREKRSNLSEGSSAAWEKTLSQRILGILSFYLNRQGGRGLIKLSPLAFRQDPAVSLFKPGVYYVQGNYSFSDSHKRILVRQITLQITVPAIQALLVGETPTFISESIVSAKSADIRDSGNLPMVWDYGRPQHWEI